MSMTPKTLYRHLLSATRLTFRDDALALAASRERIRAAFNEPTTTAAAGGQEEVRRKVREGMEVVRFLRRNVVQGVRKAGEDWEGKGKGKGKGEEGGVYALRIHGETERGDNGR